nr:protocatechuate 3,4-dioxygenase subunit alpha [Nocardioides albus]
MDRARGGRPVSTPTPGQTIGPFFGYALPYEGDADLVPPGSAGSIRLHGWVYDGAGNPIPDALLEIWQTDSEGNIPQAEGSLHRDGWTFTGWGRADTDLNGHYTFSTVLPGASAEGSAPFFALTVFARGLLDKLQTRIYLPEHPANAGDALLVSLSEDERATLVATADATGLRFDIHLQGDRETTFLNYG